MCADQKSDSSLEEITGRTISHYQGVAQSFWEHTRDHDVSQNIESLLGAMEGEGPHRILDFGCGPGRDLMEFVRRGHRPVGLDGTLPFVEMARAHPSNMEAKVEVWHQNFLELELPSGHFDGVFANASLFHVPISELPRVLGQLWGCLRRGGVLFSSNPRGTNEEGWRGERYGAWHDLEHWTSFLVEAGFQAHSHYFRPPGLPRAEQPWLASLWRRPHL